MAIFNIKMNRRAQFKILLGKPIITQEISLLIDLFVELLPFN